MKDVELMYTTDDRRLFWVAGYTADDNTSNVVEKCAHLLEYAQTFADAVGCEVGQVLTFFNDRPPRYQYMRVFHIETDKVPEGAFVWKAGWTMWKVLTN